MPVSTRHSRQLMTVTTTSVSSSSLGASGPNNADNDATTPITKKRKSAHQAVNNTPDASSAEHPREAVVVTPSPPPPNKRKTTKKNTPSSKKNRRSSSPPRAHTPPENWQEIYSLVEELRKDRTAPCDHSGCEALPDADANPQEYRFQVLISLMLSSQTKDAVVGAAIRAMQNDNVLNVHSISQMDPLTLKSYIAKVGFHNNKTKYIKQTVDVLLTKYNGDIPYTAKEMICDLPGVGPKMAYICENVAWNTISGIGVDTHMHRIFNQLEFVVDTKTPEQTRIQLQSWLPKTPYWKNVNILWVGFGQEIQQDKIKILRKALFHCSRPFDALELLKKCGLDYNKVGREFDLTEEIEAVLLAKAKNKTKSGRSGGRQDDEAEE